MKFKFYLHNTFSQAMLQITTMIAGLIIPALIIHVYGSLFNGLIGSIKQFISVLSLVEAGLGMVSIAALYKPLSNNDSQAVSKIVSASKIFYNKVGCIFSALIVLLAMVFPVIVGAQVENYYSILLVLIIGFCGCLEFFVIGKYKVLLIADQHGYVITNIQTLGTIINTIAAGFLITCGANIIIMQLASSIIYIMRAVLINLYIKKKYTGINYKAKPANEALSQRWDAFIHQIAGMIVFNTDILLLTIFSTLQEVSVYTVYKMIFTAISSVLIIFTDGANPLLAKILNQSSFESFKQKYRVYETLYYLLMGLLYSATVVLFMPFVQIYTFGVKDADYLRFNIMLLFLAGEILNKIRVPQNGLVNISEHFKKTKNRAIIEAAINLTVSLILVVPFGIAGVLIGTICSYLYRTADFIIYTSKNILKTSVWISVRPILINLLFGLISVYLCCRFFALDIIGYIDWVIYAVYTTILTLLILIIGNIIFNFSNIHEGYVFLKNLKNDVSILKKFNRG